MRFRAVLIPAASSAMKRPNAEQTAAIAVAALAAGTLLWGVLAEQIGDTLFNATLV